MNYEKVIAVVVTYNRKELLLRGLDAILNQTHKIEKIILIDNASTDGTEEFLRDKKYLENQKINYIKSPVNTGGAGGFSMGMKLAMQENPDWVWVMDDDVIPESNCLEILLSYSNQHVRCLQPLHKYEDGSIQPIEYLFDYRSCTVINPVKNLSFEKGKEVTSLNITCFEGMLVHRDIVQKVGFPDPDFFIALDDIIYGLSVSYHTNIWYVRDAVLTRLIKPKQPSKLSVYYTFRNRFLLSKHVSQLGLYRPSQFWFRIVTQYIYQFFFFLKFGKFQEILYLSRGFFDGVRGRFGKL